MSVAHITAWAINGPWGASGSNIGLYTPGISGGVPSAGSGGNINIDSSSAAGGGTTANSRKVYSGAAITGTVTVTGEFHVKFAPRSQSTGSLIPVFEAKCELALANGTDPTAQGFHIYPLKTSGQSGDYIWEFVEEPPYTGNKGWNSAMSAEVYKGAAPNEKTGGSSSFTAYADVSNAETDLYLCVLAYYSAPDTVFSDNNTSYSANSCSAGIDVDIASVVTPGGGGAGAISVNDGGTIKGVGKVYVNDGGTIKECRVYVNDNGTIKQVM